MGQQLSLEPVHRGGERRAPVPPLWAVRLRLIGLVSWRTEIVGFAKTVISQKATSGTLEALVRVNS